MTYMDKLCHDCVHWDMTLTDEDGFIDDQYGNCRRYPPIPFKSYESCDGNHAKVRRACTFPITRVDDQACGEFKEK